MAKRPLRLPLLGFTLLAASSLGGARQPAGDPPRERVLAEGWTFQVDPLRVGDRQGWERPEHDRSGWRAVAVPGAWDHLDPVMDGYEGVGWYALTLPAELRVPGAHQRLRFGRASHVASVWIDGVHAGENRIGYLPFEVALPPLAGDDVPRALVVVARVENGVRYDWLPGTTTVEWVQYGGLLEPVELVTTAPVHLAHLALNAAPSGDGGARVAAVVEVANASAAPFAGRVRLAANGIAAEGAVHVGPGARASVPLALDLAGARPWSPESPALHTARARLLDASGAELDALADRFGVRSIEVRGRELLLNGMPLHVRGVNRYDELPGRGPVADEAAIRADLSAVKAAGANLVRTHYPQAPVHLAIADEIGLLFLEEVPLNWWRASWHPPVPPAHDDDRIVDLAEEALERMVRRDGNHPSLVIWSVANECRTDDARGIRAMERLLRRARELDPTRLVTYASNRDQEANRAFALADVVSVNLYFGLWDGAPARTLADMDALVREPTRARLAEIAEHFPGKPLLVTEFGTLGIPGSGGDVPFSEDHQAAYVVAAWRAIEAVPDACGGVVWCWADYRHRKGFTNEFPTFHGPFGLVTVERRPKKALEALSALWGAR